MSRAKSFCATAQLSLLAALLVAAPMAQASIGTGDSAELVFVLWDPVAKVSYSKDLGLDARYFWGDAQQDSGYQKFFRLDKTDANLAEFLKKSTKLENQRWAVVGFDGQVPQAVPGTLPKPGEYRMFTTLQQGASDGVLNPEFAAMSGMKNIDLVQAIPSASSGLAGRLNTPPAAQKFNTHSGAVSVNGSSYDLDTGTGYFAKGSGFWTKDKIAEPGDAFWGNFTVTNKVDQSSWFYMLTNGGGNLDFNASLAIDEFDNLSGNGYWGLASGSVSNSVYYDLSFTLAAATLTGKTSSDEGRARLAVTDYAAGLTSRAVAIPEGEFFAPQAVAFSVSAVPEPGTWASMALGLIGLAGLCKRRAKQKAVTQLS